MKKKMKLKKYLIQWIGENNKDRLGLLLRYLGCGLMTLDAITGWNVSNSIINFMSGVYI